MALRPRAKAEFRGGLLYKFVNRATGAGYIGITCAKFESRKRQHIRQARLGPCLPGGFHEAIRQHGIAAFDHKILGRFDSAEAMLEAEEAAIEAHGTLTPAGYNLQRGGIAWSRGGQEVQFRGKVYPSMAALAEAHGLRMSVLEKRLRLGWTLERAITMPVRAPPKNARAVVIGDQEFRSVSAAARHFGQDPGKVAQRVRVLTWSLPQALGIEPPPGNAKRPVMLGARDFLSVKSPTS